MRTAVTLPALLSMPFKPVRLWMIDREIRNSEREAEVIEMQRQQLSAELRQHHMKQVQLAAKKRQLERR